METHLLAGEGVIRMAPSLFIDTNSPYYKYRSSTTRQSTICQSAER